MYVRFPLSLRNVEDLLHERGIDVSHETVRFWWNRFGPMFAAEIRRRRVDRMRAFSNWRWHVDEVFVKINGERHYLWRAVQQAAFKQLTDSFGFKIILIPVQSYSKMFERVADGDADAAITNRYYGLKHAKKYALENTAVVFHPTNLFFAARNGENECRGAGRERDCDDPPVGGVRKIERPPDA